MTDLDTMIRDCLQERAETVEYADPVAGARERSRRKVRRQQIAAGATTTLVVAAGVPLGLALASHHPARHRQPAVVVQASPTQSPQPPSCPSGRVPNLTVDESAAPQPLSNLIHDVADARIYFVVANGVVFHANGQAPPARSYLLIVTNRSGAGAQDIVTSPDAFTAGGKSLRDRAHDYVEKLKGWNATFAGCQAKGS
ncbi:MAG TPA: hypothetical protein VME70_04550 [Mycobacteriales bacterium]|nr:hypothetical protein [Mycobacteriales bacterium]